MLYVAARQRKERQDPSTIERTRKKKKKIIQKPNPSGSRGPEFCCSLLCRKLAALLPQINLELALRSALGEGFILETCGRGLGLA